MNRVLSVLSVLLLRLRYEFRGWMNPGVTALDEYSLAGRFLGWTVPWLEGSGNAG